MNISLQTTFRGLEHSDALEEAIRQHAEKLEHFHPHIVSCRVVIELVGKHKQQGRQFVVHIDLKVPGKEIVIDRDHDEDPYIAMQEAFTAARRKVEEHARIRRGEVKKHASAAPEE